MPYKMKVKNYIFADNIKSVSKILLQGSNSMIIAGGTAIYLLSNKGLLSDIETLIDIEPLGLNNIYYSQDKLTIQSMANLQDLLYVDKVPNVIKDAIKTIPKEVRNVGTIGGQLYTSFPHFDVAVALLSLDTEIILTNSEEIITKRIDEFFKDIFTPDVPKGYIIESVNINLNKFNVSRYFKISLTAHGLSIASMGISARVNNNVIEDIRISVGGELKTPPVRLIDVEKALRGKEINSIDIEEIRAKTKNSEYLKTSDSIKGSEKYKKYLYSNLITSFIKDLKKVRS